MLPFVTNSVKEKVSVKARQTDPEIVLWIAVLLKA